MSIFNKIKEVISDKTKLIKLLYFISLILGLVTLSLFSLDLDNGNEYRNFYMVAFDGSSTNMLYLVTAIIIFYYVLTSAFSFIANTFFPRKDPKVRSNSLKYARFNEILTFSLTGVFAIMVLVFFILIKVFIGTNMNVGFSVLIGIFAFTSIVVNGLGDYYDEVLTNIRAKEIIDQKKKEAEEAKIAREEKEKKTKKTPSKK